MKKTASAILFAAALLFAFSQCTGSGSGQVTANQAEIDSLRAQIASLTATNEAIAKNLDKFDTLDFTIFSNQEWARFHESHAPDIRVYWPDGRLTEGLDIHIEDLKKLFVHAPDTRIKEHPIRFGSGSYTAVTGVFEGTFSEPMPIGDGKFIQPTGKVFQMPMATIGIWKDGVMVEEHLFWDNQTYLNQIGLGQ